MGNSFSKLYEQFLHPDPQAGLAVYEAEVKKINPLELDVGGVRYKETLKQITLLKPWAGGWFKVGWKALCLAADQQHLYVLGITQGEIEEDECWCCKSHRCEKITCSGGTCSIVGNHRSGVFG